jgi:hypothetical protein
LLGFDLHRMMPPTLRGDFQDMAAWRQGVFEVLDLALEGSTGPVIVPMTGGLGRAVQLIAGRDAALRVESFAVSRLDLCLERLQEPEFGEQVWTDHLTIAQVADHIAASAGLSVTPNSDSKLRGRLRRAWVGARQIRFVKTGFRR